MSTHRLHGFTLLELMVSIAIFAFVASLAYGGLSAIVTQQTIAAEQMAELQSLQRTMTLLGDDFHQLQPRHVRDELGRSVELPLLAEGRGEFSVRFTRGGWRNPVPATRSTLQRVQYRLDEEKLIREYWPVLDRTLTTEPFEEELLEGVISFELTYLDKATREWRAEWPPLNSNDPAADWPVAVRVTMELNGLGEIQRIFEVAG